MSRFLKSIIAINCAILLAALGLLVFHMHDSPQGRNIIGENFYGEKIYLDDDEYEYAYSRNENKEEHHVVNLDRTKKHTNIDNIILKDI